MPYRWGFISSSGQSYDSCISKCIHLVFFVALSKAILNICINLVISNSDGLDLLIDVGRSDILF